MPNEFHRILIFRARLKPNNGSGLESLRLGENIDYMEVNPNVNGKNLRTVCII